MKTYFSKIAIVASILLTILVSVSIYFVNHEFSVPSPYDFPTRPSSAAESSSAAARPSPKKSAHNVPASNTQGAVALNNKPVLKEQYSSLSDRDKDSYFAVLEQSNQAPLTESDLALPPPSGENVMAESTGEYADQINPKVDFYKAESEGDPLSDVALDSHPPTGKNVESEPQGENAREVSQPALIEEAKYEGYLK